MHKQWRWVVVVMALLVSACAEGPTGMAREARVAMNFLTPATVRTVVVEVSGPGISPPVVVNIPVAADSTARDTLTLTAGAGRRFVVTALDSAGVTTHRADTTITLQAGVNAPLAMRLEPLASSLGITVMFGGVRIVVPDTSTRVLNVGDSTSIQAFVITASGDTMPGSSLSWGTSNPAVARVANGSVTGVRTGTTRVSVSFLGAAASVGVMVLGPGQQAPDPLQVLFMTNRDGPWALYLMAISGQVDSVSVSRTTNAQYGRFSPDGSEVLYEANGRIIAVTLSTGAERSVVESPSLAVVRGAEYAPGGRIVFSGSPTGASGSFDLFSVSLDGTDLLQITDTPGVNEDSPEYSADGSQLVFQCSVGDQWDVCTMQADATGRRNLTEDFLLQYQSGRHASPRWSPDGTEIVFWSYAPSAQISIMRADGTNRRVLTSLTGDNYLPLWTPGGHCIVFTGTLKPEHSVNQTYIMRRDGSAVRRLSSSSIQTVATSLRSPQDPRADLSNLCP